MIINTRGPSSKKKEARRQFQGHNGARQTCVVCGDAAPERGYCFKPACVAQAKPPKARKQS